MSDVDSTRNSRAASLKEVKAHYIVLSISGLDEHRGLNGWRYCQVKVSELRNMHGKFGRPEVGFIELLKGERLQVQLNRNRGLVDTNRFPRADTIKQKWPDKPALIVQQTKNSGELYVSDGVTRTLNACYHHESWLDAYVIELDQKRDVID